MRRDTLVQLVALGLMLAFLSASAALTPVIASSVGRNRLVYADTAEAGDPPQVAAGIAMGAFRGVFVNYLWIRANNLKEEGKYHEAIDLAKTITRLQPRFPKVWAFHAWNLAYNISVTTQTPQERWQWVQSGINLLRDQGIPNNPNDLVLHKELAWIFLHKVQGYMDDAHQFFKRAHAREWTIALGAPPQRPLGISSPQQVSQLYVERWIGPIASAPDTIEEVYAERPEARGLVERLRTEAGLGLDQQFLERVEMIRSVLEAAQKTGVRPNIEDPLAGFMLDPQYQEAGRLLLKHVRKRLLIDHYHMEPDRMVRYTQKFGPLDWRHGSAHAVYWAARGVEEAAYRVTAENRSDFDFLNTDRLVVQGIQDLFRTGMVFYDIANPTFYFTLPNADFLDSYSNYREEAHDRGGVFTMKSKSRNEYAAGQENFLRDAIRFLFRRGDRAKAEEYYRKLRTADWLNTHNPEIVPRLSLPLEEFVVSEIVDENRITSPPVALQEVGGALHAAYIEGLLGGNSTVFTESFRYAQMFHAEYQKSQAFRTWVAGEQGRLGFPPFDIFASQILAGLIMAAGVPQGPILYQSAPPELRCRAYIFLSAESIKPAMDAAAAEQGAPPFDAWFPPPQGVEQCRQELQMWFQRGPDQGRTELK